MLFGEAWLISQKREAAAASVFIFHSLYPMLEDIEVAYAHVTAETNLIRFS
jgi:hypothetical protein